MQEARTTERSSCCRSKLSLCIHIFAYCLESWSDEDAVAYCATRVVASVKDSRKRSGPDSDKGDGHDGDAGEGVDG